MLIVTDSAVDLPESLLGSRLVSQVPGEVWTKDGPLRVSGQEFWSRLRGGAVPSSRPPTVSALLAAYRHGDLVIAMHVSGQLSATVQRAEEAAERIGSGVCVIDTGSLSVGAGLLVSEVVQAAERGTSSSLVDLARSLPFRLHTFALVQDIGALRRSDRASLVPSAHLARDHPLVVAIRGRAVPLAQPKRRSAALHELATHLRHHGGPAPVAWALGHGDASDLHAVVRELERVIGLAPSFVTYIDPTVGVHLGRDALVVGVLSEPAQA